MNTETRQLILKAVESVHLAAEDLLVYRSNGWHKSCISCRAFDEATEMCNTAKQRPPARVIAFGCQQYDDADELPF